MFKISSNCKGVMKSPLPAPISNLLKVTIAAHAVSFLIAPAIHATELIYTPVNPAFGGSPLNSATLLNAANAQNKHKDPEEAASRASSQRTPLEQFNETLQRSILSRVASAASGQVLDAGGRLVPGVVDSANFSIAVNDLGGGALQITTTDKTTGVSTSFQVNQ